MHWWSHHRGGANFLFVDSAVRFLSYEVDDNAFAPLATRDSGDIGRLRFGLDSTKPAAGRASLCRRTIRKSMHIEVECTSSPGMQLSNPKAKGSHHTTEPKGNCVSAACYQRLSSPTCQNRPIARESIASLHRWVVPSFWGTSITRLPCYKPTPARPLSPEHTARGKYHLRCLRWQINQAPARSANFPPTQLLVARVRFQSDRVRQAHGTENVSHHVTVRVGKTPGTDPRAGPIRVRLSPR